MRHTALLPFTFVLGAVLFVGCSTSSDPVFQDTGLPPVQDTAGGDTTAEDTTPDTAVAQECDPATFMALCAAKQRVYCLPDGSGYGAEDCPLGCEEDAATGAAVCVTQLCEGGEQKCLDSRTLLVCKPSGTAWQSYTCPAPPGLETGLCEDGDCVLETPSCQGDPAERRCDGSYLLECTPEGDGWVQVERCPFGCENAQCKDAVCAESEVACSPDDDSLIVRCNNTRTEWVPVQQCDSVCEDGACVDRPCTAGEYRCNGTAAERCRQDGSGFDIIDSCSLPCFMDGNVAKCPVCLAGARMCFTNKAAAACTNPGAATVEEGFQVVEDCDPAEQCVQGFCAPALDFAYAPSERDELMMLAQGSVDCWRAHYGSREKVLCFFLDTTTLLQTITQTVFLDDFLCDETAAPVPDDYTNGQDDYDEAEALFGCGFFGSFDFNVTVEPGYEDRYCLAYDPSWFDSVTLDLCEDF